MLFSLTLLVLIVVAAAACHLRVRRQSAALALQQNAFAVMRVQLLLCRYLAVHRGAMNSLLAGETSFQATVDETRVHLDEQLKNLESTVAAIAPLFSANWVARISESTKQAQAFANAEQGPQSFLHHTLLIRELLNETHRLAHATEYSGQAEVRDLYQNTLGQQLPQLAEILGQARGAASRIAAAGELSNADRVKLAFMAQRASDIQNTIRERGNDARIANFVNMLETGLLADNGRIYKAADVFQHGSDAITVVLQLIDEKHTQTEQRLQTCISIQRRRLQLSRIGSCVAGGLLLGGGATVLQ